MSDWAVQRLTIEEEGAYRRLLDHQWLNGSVPAELWELSIICKNMPLVRMRKIWARLIGLFPDVGEGRLQNGRLERIREERESFRRKQRENGTKGAAKRWPADSQRHGDPIANSEPDGSSSLPLPLPLPENNNNPTAAPARRELEGAVRAAIGSDACEALDRVLRSTGNPGGVINHLARALAVSPTLIPTGPGGRGRDPKQVAIALVEFANGDRPTWNASYFDGCCNRVTARMANPAAPERTAAPASGKRIRSLA